jgi:hypothetical protein
MFDEPDVSKGYYGGHTAAPVFKRVAEQVANYLKIRPDREEAMSEMARKAGPPRVRTAGVGTPAVGE